MSKYFDNALFFLILLIPLALITGPFLPDLIVVICSIIFLLISLIKKEYKYYKSFFFKIFFIFWIYICIVSFFSGNYFYSFASSIVYIRFIIFCLAVWYILDVKENTHFYLLFSLSISFLLVLFSGYMQYFFDISFNNYFYDGRRLTGLFGEEQILGSYLSRIYAFFLAILFYIIKKPRLLIFLFLLSFISFDVLIFLSGERTAFVYLLIISVLTILCLEKFKITRLIGFLFSCVIIFFILTLDSSVKDRMLNSTLDNLNITNKMGKDKSGSRILAFSPAHENIYKTSLKIYKDNPVFGIGVKMFRIECKKEEYYHAVGCRNHPHNTYIQLLLETGIFGFLFFFSIFLIISLVLFYQSIYVLFNKRIFNLSHSLNNYQVCLIISIFISLWPIAPTGNFFHNWLNVIYFLPVGFLLNSLYKK